MTSSITRVPSRRPLNICYAGEPYESLRRAGAAYLQLLRNGYDQVVHVTSLRELADGLEQADVVILHVSAQLIEQIYARFPRLKDKYVIGYLVWETNKVPEQWEKGIACVQEIWTASRYCRAIFQKYHPRVVRIPHVAERDLTCTMRDLAFMRKLIGYRAGCFYFLTIASVTDRRKNVDQLLETFLSAGSRMKNARLIVKSCWRQDPASLTDDERVIYLRHHFTAAQLNALYRLSNVYVSAHHSEGWGFTLSDAILFRMPIIATAYSGNLDYMNEANSFLVSCKEASIQPKDDMPPFSTGMQWAYPDQADLEEKLVLVYNSIATPWVEEKVAKALLDIAKFSSDTVSALIGQRLEEISTFIPESVFPTSPHILP